MINLKELHKQLKPVEAATTTDKLPASPVEYEQKETEKQIQSLELVLSKLSKKVVDLISQEDRGSFESRSERDLKLMGYLKRYNIPFESVCQIFMNYPCGSKAREHTNPSDYLRRTFDKARPIKSGQYFKTGKAFNTQEFIEQFLATLKSKMLYRNLNFYEFNGTHYDLVESDRMKKSLYDFFGSELSDSRLNSILNLLKTGLMDSSVVDPFGQLNFSNGVFDMKTKTLFPQSSSWFFTSIYPFNYNPDSDCPNYKKFLKQILGDDPDLLALDQEWLGYSLTYDTSLQRFRINLGDGSNGKTTQYHVMMAIVGKENYHNGTLSMLWSEREAHILQGKKVLFTEELNYLGQVNSARLKEAVDGYIHCNPKYEEPFSFRNTAKFIVNTNELPNSADPTLGMTRRMIIVNYDTIIPEKDRDPQYYEKYLEPELAGIMNYALAGYDRLMKQKHFTKCGASDIAVQKYMRESSPVKTFVSEACILAPDQRVQKHDLFGAFIKFCDRYNIKQNFNYMRFARELNSYCRQMGTDLRTSDTLVGAQRVKTYIGIGLNHSVNY
ncbi:hypothetical protein KJ762_12625 [bacterium]|nr:hypothetical protein [bacterium]MBU1635337.1 hypothetical protein [bacterium]MBU1873799.1 hypothetical protein [bacterium]